MLKKVLVANRGEIALRVIRACRELGVPSVAVYSDADRQALHVRAATEAWHIGGSLPAESYLKQERILQVAEKSGADSVHPGYGFLSENGGFAQAVLDQGLKWIGPPPAAITGMGEKIEARRAMEAAKVPVVPGLTEEAGDGGALASNAREMGYPVLLKAAGGGGGKGIRVVEREEDLLPALERARSEAQNSFGNPAVYMEKYLAEARHIEIQVFADEHGQVVHLGERECSLQRRHQKVIEEAPCVVMTEELREAMGQAAIRAAGAVNYVSAGTVEFLVDRDHKFYFLEMNTRLQVEHPVTELVTGLDLVREQLRVAAGEKLSFAQEDVGWRGHSIEARICAEDPENGFLPSTGLVTSLDVPGGSHVRFDSALYSGLEIGVFYDPMLAKLIVHARDREAAIRRMKRALQELKVTGVTTNIAFLYTLCNSEAFRGGDYHTRTIEDDLDGFLQAPPTAHLQRTAVLAAAVHREIQRRSAAEAQGPKERNARGSLWSRHGLQRATQRWTP
jgi:acetyl-CoA carboxylase biotin carboxylase subunit